MLGCFLQRVVSLVLHARQADPLQCLWCLGETSVCIRQSQRLPQSLGLAISTLRDRDGGPSSAVDASALRGAPRASRLIGGDLTFVLREHPVKWMWRTPVDAPDSFRPLQ